MRMSEKSLAMKTEWVFCLRDSTDKSFWSDGNTTLFAMVIDKTLYWQSISPIVSCSQRKDSFMPRITGIIEEHTQPHANRHTHTQKAAYHFLSSSPHSPATSANSNHHQHPQSFLSNLETRTCLTTTIPTTRAAAAAVRWHYPCFYWLTALLLKHIYVEKMVKQIIPSWSPCISIPVKICLPYVFTSQPPWNGVVIISTASWTGATSFNKLGFLSLPISLRGGLSTHEKN